MAIDQEAALLDDIVSLLPAQFARLKFKLKIPRWLLSENASLTEQAIDLIRYFQQRGRSLKTLKAEVDSVLGIEPSPEREHGHLSHIDLELDASMKEYTCTPNKSKQFEQEVFELANKCGLELFSLSISYYAGSVHAIIEGVPEELEQLLDCLTTVSPPLRAFVDKTNLTTIQWTRSHSDTTYQVVLAELLLPHTLKPTSSAQVRASLVRTLELDLIGPGPDHPDHREETLKQPPSSWYLTGFLVPFEASVEQRSDDIGQGDLLDTIDKEPPSDDAKAPEVASARRAFFPSSMGMSVLLPAKASHLDVEVSWGDYEPQDEQDEEVTTKANLRWTTWRRIPRRETVQVALTEDRISVDVPDSKGLVIEASIRAIHSEALVPAGTRAVSLFLVNRRKQADDRFRDAAFTFQTRLHVSSPDPLVPRPDVRGLDGDDWDEAVADVQYRDDFEFAVGHNVSVRALTDTPRVCHRIETTWTPSAQVEKVVPHKVEGVNLKLEDLAQTSSAEAVRAMVGDLVNAYEAWIKDQTGHFPARPERQKIATHMMRNAKRAADRIREGLASLNDPDALEAFKLANKVIAVALRQRWSQEQDKAPDSFGAPAWRPFQLAFILMNLPGIIDPHHADRENVDLLFFPTGGGKTEAYLGLAAFSLVLRRLRADGGIHGAGVSVIMRYTLRLLTLDQLGRAATLICALELERQDDPKRLGEWPFEIALWVGQSATPNRMGKRGDNDRYSARKKTLDFKRDDKLKPSPIPLESCPWCGSKFTRNSFQLRPNDDRPTNLKITCGNRKKRCPWGGRNPLPILSVDEPIYRRLPCFIIATVDKFAQLPWVGHTGALFGKVNQYHPRDGFYGPADKARGTKPLDAPLPPPDLIIQDELHLISGPLGTMVGLYETAIDALCTTEGTHAQGDIQVTERVRPKIVASTATVRRADKQIRALFCRNDVDVFPPPGPDRRDSFFARTVPPDERDPRLYVGVAAQGRSLKVILLRTALALMSAAKKQYDLAGGKRNKENPADPYMTFLGYFSALRELGGSRRIFEDEVASRLSRYGEHHRMYDPAPDFADRKISLEPRELTSREPTNKVAETKQRLALSYHEKHHVDVALATNMISVGLDITRLGLMVVHGQPKTASEYIQATSRVGRDDKRPGLVVTLMNIHRPRDRSHYERFEAWHRTFYRAVEATSVTPFSPRAIDRGLAAITVALARLGHAPLTYPTHALNILNERTALDFVSHIIAERGETHDADLSSEEQEELRHKLKARVKDLLDAWEVIARRQHQEGAKLQYGSEVGGAPPLLYQPLDPELRKQPSPAEKFKAQRSLRDVEPNVNLWLRRPGEPDDFSEDP